MRYGFPNKYKYMGSANLGLFVGYQKLCKGDLKGGHLSQISTPSICSEAASAITCAHSTPSAIQSYIIPNQDVFSLSTAQVRLLHFRYAYA